MYWCRKYRNSPGNVIFKKLKDCFPMMYRGGEKVALLGYFPTLQLSYLLNKHNST